ncbi:MAG: hypothetical protein AAF218_10495 [Pseudomonadota bacterium]
MRALAAAFVMLAVPAIAQDGLYYPEGYGAWDCQSVGSDGGALEIREGWFYGVESACELTNPVAVRDMGATLYDGVCSAEGTEYTERLMIMTAFDGAVIVVRKGFASRLLPCQ